METQIVTRIQAAVASDPRFVNADVSVDRIGTAYRVRVEAIGRQGTGRIPVEFSIPIPA